MCAAADDDIRSGVYLGLDVTRNCASRRGCSDCKMTVSFSLKTLDITYLSRANLTKGILRIISKEFSK